VELSAASCSAGAGAAADISTYMPCAAHLSARLSPRSLGKRRGSQQADGRDRRRLGKTLLGERHAQVPAAEMRDRHE
jgi:hypothetical protein